MELNNKKLTILLITNFILLLLTVIFNIYIYLKLRNKRGPRGLTGPRGPRGPRAIQH